MDSTHWESMSNADYEELADKALNAGLRFLKDGYAQNLIVLERLASAEILLKARSLVSDAIAMQAQFAIGDPYRDLSKTSAEAKLALKELKKIARLLDGISSLARFMHRNNTTFQNGILSPYVRESIDDAIGFFQKRSGSNKGRRANIGYTNAAEYLCRAFETLSGNPFKRDLSMAEHARKEQIFVNLDAQFVECVFRVIDPTITRSNVKSAIQGHWQAESYLKKRAGKSTL